MNEQSDLFGGQLPPRILIERAVPIPTSRVSSQRIKWDAVRDVLQFERLQIGDSFAIRSEWIPEADTIRIQNFLSGAACSFRKTYGPGAWAFTTRQMPDGSVRIWRIDPSDARGRGE